MKKNLILLIVLIGIGIFTYHFEELGGQKRIVEDRELHQIIDEEVFGEIIEIKGVNFKILKLNDRFYVDDKKIVDPKRLQKYFEILSSMRVRRYLKPDEFSESKRQLFFPEKENYLTFIFKKGKVTFRLGKKLGFDQSFYMEVEKETEKEVDIKQMIAFDSTPHLGTYEKEGFHKNSRKYDRFMTMILLTKEFFIDTHLFQKEFFSKKAAWNNIEVRKLGKLISRFDLEKHMTWPLPPKGLKFDINSFQIYVDELVGSSGIKWLKNGKLEEYITTLLINKIDGKKETIKIYKKLNSESGYFAHLIEKNKTLSFSQKAVNLFEKPSQEFWDLKALPIPKPDQLKLSFPGEKDLNVIFKYDGSFEAKLLKNMKIEAINTSFKDLVDIFTSKAYQLSPLDAGISLDSSLYRVRWNSKKGLEPREFHVILKKQELVLANIKHGYKLHYHLKDVSKLGTELKDFFLKQ